MCFSSEASLIAGSVLTITSVATIKKVKHQRDIPIALIPLLFAIQQFTEGFLWIALEDGDMPQAQFWLANLYGVFVGIVWPLYAPFAVYNGEPSIRRRRIIIFTGLIGLGLAIYTILGLFKAPVVAEIIDNSISYEHEIDGYRFVLVMYLLATCIPFVISSYRFLYTAGIVIIVGFFVAFFTYENTFASVWCFFAAIASTLIYFYITKHIKKPLIPLPTTKNL